MCIAIVCLPGFEIRYIDIIFSFLIKPFFHMTKKVETKIPISLKQKEFLRWNRKDFSSLSKGFQ